MELTTQTLPIEYLRRGVQETVYQEQTSEVLVPESLPEMSRILGAFGTPLLQEKRMDGGELRLSGGVQADVLYVPEGDKEAQTLDAWLPFSLRKSVDAPDGCVIVRIWLKSIDARMVNSRKAIVRANIGMELRQFVPEQLALASVSDAPPQLQVKQNTYPVLLPVACGEQEFRVQDELALPDAGPAMDRVLKWELTPTVEESRMIGNKAVFQGTVAVQVLFLGTDGSIDTFVGQLPFSQYVELPGEWPDGVVAVFPAITAAQVETDGQMESRTLLLDLNLLAQICVFDQIRLTLNEDAYAVGAELVPTWQQVSVQPILDTQHTQKTAELTLPCTAQRVVEVSVCADQPVLRRNQENVSAVAALSGNLLYEDTEGKLRSKSLRGECVLDSKVAENCRCYPGCRVSAPPETAIHAEQVQICVPLEFSVEIVQDAQWQNLAGGEIVDAALENRPSVIVRRWHGGALWPLAKQLGATVADIEAANSITGEQAPENEILLIPVR